MWKLTFNPLGTFETENMSHFMAEEPREMSADLLCRVCACASEELVPVFGEKGLELQLLDKIHTHLPIMVKYKLIHDIIQYFHPSTAHYLLPRQVSIGIPNCRYQVWWVIQESPSSSYLRFSHEVLFQSWNFSFFYLPLYNPSASKLCSLQTWRWKQELPL